MRFQGVAAGLRALRLREGAITISPIQIIRESSTDKAHCLELAPEDPIDSNVNRNKLSYEDLKSKDSIRILRL
jgi:hypothetical protein